MTQRSGLTPKPDSAWWVDRRGHAVCPRLLESSVPFCCRATPCLHDRPRPAAEPARVHLHINDPPEVAG